MKNFFVFLFFTLVSVCSNAAVISGVNTFTADAKDLGYALAGLAGVVACIVGLNNIAHGISRYTTVILSVIGIATIGLLINYLRGNFGG